MSLDLIKALLPPPLVCYRTSSENLGFTLPHRAQVEKQAEQLSALRASIAQSAAQDRAKGDATYAQTAALVVRPAPRELRDRPLRSPWRPRTPREVFESMHIINPARRLLGRCWAFR